MFNSRRLCYTFFLLFILPISLATAAGRMHGGGGTISSTTYINSYVAGYSDVNSHFVGGTEIRAVVAHYIPNGDPMPDGTTCSSALTLSWISGTSTCAIVLAGNGYWMDLPGAEGYQYPQVLALTTPSGKWLQDKQLTLAQKADATHNRFAVVDVMSDHTFTLNTAGSAISIEIASAVVQSSGGTVYYSRNDTAGTWVTFTNNSGGTQQDRSITYHTDNVLSTPLEYMLVGEDTGIFHCTMTTAAGSLSALSCSTTPEPFVYSGASCVSLNTIQNCTNDPGQWGAGPTLNTCTPPLPGTGAPVSCQGQTTCIVACNMVLRVMAMANCQDGSGNFAAYASIGDQVWKRADGASPKWNLFAFMPNTTTGTNVPSANSGQRGLTCVPALNGDTGQDLLMSTESSAPAVWRVSIDGDNGLVTTGTYTNMTAAAGSGLNASLRPLFNTTCGAAANTYTYQIDSYNNMQAINNSMVFGGGTTHGPQAGTATCPNATMSGPTGGPAYLSNKPGIYVESIKSPTCNVNNPPTSCFTLSLLPLQMPNGYEVSTRSLVASPFPSDAYVFAAGMDANSYQWCHNFAWVMRVLTSSLSIP